MPSRTSHHIRRNAIAYLALFAALSGTAWAGGLVGPRDIRDDAVRSRHIKGGQVKGQDVNAAQVQLRIGGSCPSGQAIRVISGNGTVACEVDDAGAGGGGPPTGPAGGDLTGSYPNPQIGANAVGSAEVADGSLTALDLGPSSVGTSEAVDDSLTGLDIQEVSLDASNFTRGRSARANVCDPDDTVLVSCVSRNLSFPRPARALIDAHGRQVGPGLFTSGGLCGLSVDGSSPFATGGPISHGTLTEVYAPGTVAITAVTEPLGAFAHTFELLCNDEADDAQISEPTISVVMIGGA